MNIDRLALYQRSLLGGIGGLVGWALLVLIPELPSDTKMLHLFRVCVTGSMIGLAIGAACGAWNGLIRDRSRQRLVHGACIGAGIGFFGGAAGLVCGEIIFAIAGGGLFSRAFGWSFFGALVGTNEGISQRSRQKTAFGAFGGFLGGLLGGSTYEFLAILCQGLGFARDVAIAMGGAVGLMLLGLLIGCLIGVVEDLLRPAWLTFTAGRFEGQTRTLDLTKTVITVGRAELADICILGDPQVASQHARIVPDRRTCVLEAVEGKVLLYQGATWIPITRHALQTGDMLQIGASRAVFQMGGAS